MTTDPRTLISAVSRRVAVIERRSETAAIRALKRHAWTLVTDRAACEGDVCTAEDRCLPCETWTALGYGARWPGPERAERALGGRL